VDNQGANKNYTARLVPHVARGTNSFDSPVLADDRRIGVGPRDNFFATLGTDVSVSQNGADAIRFTFGLMFTPRDSRFRVSPLMVDQIRVFFGSVYVSSGSVSNTVAANSGRIADVRAYRQVRKFVVADAQLLAFLNIVDAATSIEYRVGQVADSGRPCNLGIEWPATVVVVSGS
jgi:hypothetical protein